MDWTATYLARLGLTVEPPSIGALLRLHRAQVERIPYETFWIHLREQRSIAPHESLRRLAGSRRGGYCFQLNGALGLVLRELGYSANWYAAGVHESSQPSTTTLGNHVAVIVDELPTPTNPGGRWYVDAGLGDGLYDPLPLRPGHYNQGPVGFSLGAAASVGDWQITRDVPGSFVGVSIIDRAVQLDQFADRHRHNLTAPDSSFARLVTAQCRNANEFLMLRGCVLTRRGATTTETTTLDTPGLWLGVLAEQFGLYLDVHERDIDALWRRVRKTHAEWSVERIRDVRTRA